MNKNIIILSHFVNNTESNYLFYTHSHAKEFIKLGYNVFVFAPKAISSLKILLKKNVKKNTDGVNICINKRISLGGFLSKSKINFNGIFYYLSVKNKIKKLMRENNVFYIDAHNFKSEGYTAYLLKKKYPNVKVTITFHGSDLEQMLSYKNGIKLLKKASKYIDCFVCVSEKLEKKLNNIGIYNTKVIYNGIEFFEFPTVKKSDVITSIGDLIDSKNFDLLISAFYEFHKNNKNYKLNIIGSGPLLNQLKNLVANFDLSESVNFTGQISNNEVYSYLSKSKIFILPSSPEGFGIVYAEAMYNKCITIGVKGEGIDGFIKNGVNGFLIRTEKKDIVNILEYCCKNDCKKIMLQAKKDTLELSWKNNVIQYLKLITKI